VVLSGVCFILQLMFIYLEERSIIISILGVRNNKKNYIPIIAQIAQIKKFNKIYIFKSC